VIYLFALAALTAADRIRLEPLPPPAAGRTGMLGFSITAPWMRGHIELRMPETLASSAGLHFIDHSRADMPPLSIPAKWPEWKIDARNGRISYRYRTPEGVEFAAAATPLADTVRLEFRVRNRSSARLGNVGCQMCLVLAPCEQFAARGTLEPVRAWFGGEFRSLAGTTPTPAEKRREPWVLMRVRGPGDAYSGPMEWPDGWWVVDQFADEPVIARVSDDGKWLVAVEWGARQPMLMTNTRIPCLHAGPGDPVDLEPGAEHGWRGTIYLVPNDAGKLAERLRRKWGRLTNVRTTR
jgi:hypothetical protein